MVILWLFAANYDDSNFYFMIFIVESFLSALVFIFISILLQGYRESWFFLHSLLFGKNAYREETNSRVGEQSWRMGRVASQWGSGLLSLLPRWSVTWRANVACEVAVAIISLFKLEVWKTLGKPYPLLNYEDYWRAVENTDYRSNCFTCPVFNKIFKSLKKSENIHIVSFKRNKNIWTK